MELPLRTQLIRSKIQPSKAQNCALKIAAHRSISPQNFAALRRLYLAQIEILFFSKSWNNFSPKKIFLPSLENFCSSSLDSISRLELFSFLLSNISLLPRSILFLVRDYFLPPPNISLLPRRLNSISHWGLFPSVC